MKRIFFSRGELIKAQRAYNQEFVKNPEAFGVGSAIDGSVECAESQITFLLSKIEGDGDVIINHDTGIVQCFKIEKGDSFVIVPSAFDVPAILSDELDNLEVAEEFEVRISTVEMTEAELNALPEFEGF